MMVILDRDDEEKSLIRKLAFVVHRILSLLRRLLLAAVVVC